MPEDFFDKRRRELGITAGDDFFEKRRMELGLIPDTRPKVTDPGFMESRGLVQPTAMDVTQTPLMDKVRAAGIQPSPEKKEPFLVQIQKDAYDKVISPIQDKVYRVAAGAADAVTFGQSKKHTENMPDFMAAIEPVQKALQPAQTTGDKVADVAGEILGSLPSVGGAYATGGRLALEGVARFAPNAPRIVANLARGFGAGAAYGAASEGIDAASGGKASIGERAKNVAANAAFFGAGDAALSGAGTLLAKAGVPQKVSQAFTNFINRNKPAAEDQPVLALPPATRYEEAVLRSKGTVLPPNETPIAGQGHVHTFELPDPTIPKILQDIKSETYQRITPPLENPNELAKWVQQHLGIDQIPLNEVRKLPYEDLREMAEMMRQRLNPMETAAAVANEKGYVLSDLMKGKAVTGQAAAPVDGIRFDRRRLPKGPARTLKVLTPEELAKIDFPFENVPGTAQVKATAEPAVKAAQAPIKTVSEAIGLQNNAKEARVALQETERKIAHLSKNIQSNGLNENMSARMKELNREHEQLTRILDDRVNKLENVSVDHLDPDKIDLTPRNVEGLVHLAVKDIPVEGLKNLSGYKGNLQDVFRNFKQVFKDKYGQMKKLILDPFDASKKKYAEMQDTLLKDLKENVVDKLGIKKGSRLSALVQDYGEKKIDIVELKSRAPKDWEKVVEADRYFRNAYGKLLDGINATRAKIYPTNPDKIIPKREDYYRHFREFNTLAGLKNIFDTPSGIDPKLVGLSEFTLPKSKYQSIFQRRGEGSYKRDAVGGFLDYVPAAAYATHIDPHINVFKELGKVLAERTTETKNLNGFINFLHKFSQDLAGKTNAADRFIQDLIPGGRTTMAAVQWLNNRVKANTILGNVSSVFAQVGNVPNGIASAKFYSIPGAGKTLQSIFNRAATPIGESGFLKERYLGKTQRQFNTRWFQQPMNFAEWTMETVDRMGTEFIWNSHYLKGVQEKIADPVKYADDMTRELVAGRGIGEVPLLQKSKLFQIIAPFQLEVGNYWKVIGGFVKQKDVTAVMTLLVTSFMLNKVMESVRGSGIVFDPIQSIVDASQPDLSPFQRAGRVAGEFLSNIPLGQSIAGAYPEYGGDLLGLPLPPRKDLFGDNDPTRFGTGLTLLKAFQDPLYFAAPPFGGNQVKKTVQGASSLFDGGYEKDGKLRFLIKKTPSNIAKAALFGPSDTKEGQEYYDNNRRPLSVNQTEQLEQVPAEDRVKVYERLMVRRRLESIRAKAADIAKDPNLSIEDKKKRIDVLQKEYADLTNRQ